MRNNKHNSLFVGIVLFFLVVLVSIGSITSTQLAYAGGSTGGGGGGGSGDVSDRLHWRWEWTGGSLKVFDRTGASYGTYEADGWIHRRDSLAEHTNSQYCSTNGYTSYGTRMIAYVCTDRGPWDDGDCYVYNTDGVCDWDNIYNWGNSAWDLPSELRDWNLTNYPVQVYDSILYRAYNGEDVSAVWIDPNKEWVDKTETDTKTVLTYAKGPGVNYNVTGNTPEWKYKNGVNSQGYQYTTQPNETNVSKTIESKSESILMTHTYKYNPSSGATKDHKYSYVSKGVKSDSKTIKYSVAVPSVYQVKYTPLNLNRNGYATTADIGDGYAANNNVKINATVDNRLGITDNSPIKSLDINNDTGFTFKFNNNTYGMPTNYDWDTKPSPLSNGSYENVNSGSAYCNGKASHNSDEMFRYNLNFKASTTSLTASASTSSLLYGDSTEILANDTPFTKTHTTVTNAFTGNEGWSVRFSLAGDGNSNSWYYTDNGSSVYPYWWVNTYSVARYYEYGTSYHGVIDINGVHEPVGGQGGGVTHGNYSNWNITTDVSSHQRGLYIGKSAADYVQPVLTGKWDVKTLAGDVI